MPSEMVIVLNNDRFATRLVYSLRDMDRECVDVHVHE